MGLLPRALPVQGGRILLEGEDITARRRSARLRELRATRMSMIFQEPMTALNPVMTCGDQIDEVLRAAHQALARASGARRCSRSSTRCSCPTPSAWSAQLPAPALRRPAPAHHDRDGAGARAGAADRRRADHRARRDHAGADPEADAGPAGAPRHRRAVHHARLRRRGRDRAPRRGAAPGRRWSRSASKRRGAQAPAARLHEDADRRGADACARTDAPRTPTRRVGAARPQALAKTYHDQRWFGRRREVQGRRRT